MNYFLLPTPLKGSNKGKGKGGKGTKRKSTEEEDTPKKRAKVTRDPIPDALKGMRSRTPKNKPICFNYNLGKCQKKNCKFAHVCCKPGCYGKHPTGECNKGKEGAARTEDDSD